MSRVKEPEGKQARERTSWANAPGGESARHKRRISQGANKPGGERAKGRMNQKKKAGAKEPEGKPANGRKSHNSVRPLTAVPLSMVLSKSVNQQRHAPSVTQSHSITPNCVRRLKTNFAFQRFIPSYLHPYQFIVTNMTISV